MSRAGVLFLAVVVLVACARAEDDLASKFEAKVSGARAKISGVHAAKVSGARELFGGEPAGELLAVAGNKRALLEGKLIAKVSGIHAKISGLRMHHDGALLQALPVALPVMVPAAEVVP